MTKVRVFYAGSPPDAWVHGIECRGHAGGTRDGGADLICASVSLCMEMLEEGLRHVADPDVVTSVWICESRNPGGKAIHWEGDGAEVLAETVAATLRNIAAANPQNVSVEDVFNGEDKKDEKVAES